MQRRLDEITWAVRARQVHGASVVMDADVSHVLLVAEDVSRLMARLEVRAAHTGTRSLSPPLLPKAGGSDPHWRVPKAQLDSGLNWSSFRRRAVCGAARLHSQTTSLGTAWD